MKLESKNSCLLENVTSENYQASYLNYLGLGRPFEGLSELHEFQLFLSHFFSVVVCVFLFFLLLLHDKWSIFFIFNCWCWFFCFPWEKLIWPLKVLLTVIYFETVSRLSHVVACSTRMKIEILVFWESCKSFSLYSILCY